MMMVLCYCHRTYNYGFMGLTPAFTLSHGYLHQRAGERHGNPPPS